MRGRSPLALPPTFAASSCRTRCVMIAISSTACSNGSTCLAVGRWNPLTLRTNWRAAARTSSSVATWSYFLSGLMLRHIAPAMVALGARRPLHRAEQVLELERLAHHRLDEQALLGLQHAGDGRHHDHGHRGGR